MGGRDHSETCETCGYQSGGLDDLLCACQYNGIKDATPDSVGSRDIIERLSRGAWNAHDGTTVVRLAVAEAAVQAAADTRTREIVDALTEQARAIPLGDRSEDSYNTAIRMVREVARRFPVSDCEGAPHGAPSAHEPGGRS